MLEFMRNKRVSVACEDEENFTIQAELDDSIYSLELFLKVRIVDLKCLSIRGNFRRWTTPECPRALDFLDQAEGLFLTKGVEDRIHKTIGRTSCRHFANLLIECAHGAQQSRIMVQWHQARKKNPDLPIKEFVAGEGDKNQGIILGENSSDTLKEPGEKHKGDSCEVKMQKLGSGKEKNITVLSPENAFDKKKAKIDQGFIIDLHVHTFPASACAADSAEVMVEAARKKGLNALCFTDHNHVWPEKEVDRLMALFDFQIFRGNEIMTDQGDMLVFGFHEAVDRVVKLRDLATLVDRSGGVIIAAHPFRGFLTFGTGQIGLTPQKAMERDMFKHVHAIETLNGKVTEKENGLAFQVAEGLKLPMTGGSDAHDASNIGIYATCFKSVFTNDQELVSALHSGAYGPVRL